MVLAKEATPFRRVIVILALVVLPAAGIVGYLWKLHTPNPRAKTMVVINRNSLLPHKFAGPCLNCHKIDDIGPVNMDRNNMRFFKLTANQKKLLLDGQSVRAPSLSEQLTTPAIMREDILPHKFVGVCSNCHVVLDVRPSRAYMQQSMERATQWLDLQGYTPGRIARGGTLRQDRRVFLRNVWGFIALGLFGLSSVYVFMRMLMRINPQRYAKKFPLKQWFVRHEWCSVAFTIATILHWHYSDRGNNLLHISLLIVIWLTAAGYLLRYRVAHGKLRKSVSLIHSQRLLYFGLIALLIAGHSIAVFQ